LGADRQEEAVARVEEITTFLGDGLPSEDGAVYAHAIASLTAREAEIAALIIAGERTDDIAAALAISVHTVYSHVKAILRKMGVSSRGELRQVLLSVDNALQKVVGRNLMLERS
jgi:DNA-binding CsgD family transcriptional regulator